MNVLRKNKLLPFGAATVVSLGMVYAAHRRWSHHVTKPPKLLTVKEAVCQSKSIIQELQVSSGTPGFSVAVSLNGSIVWKQGFGYADVENKIQCTPHTVVKIASISKAITSVLLAKLWEMELIDLNTDIGNYVKYWPEKYWKGVKVPLTVKQLASHRAGIRDYKPIKQKNTSELGSSESLDFDYEEYYITDTFKTVKESVSLFKDDPLISKPGDEFHYTTHGYTLLSACLEGATGKDFPTLVYNLYKDLGLNETYLDKDKQQLIYNRSCHYVKRQDDTIENAPYTESSFKLAGAGMLSTAVDLLRFGNILLYSFQRSDDMTECKPGYLKASTVQMLWQPIPGTEISWHPHGCYGMGWQIAPYDKHGSFISESITPPDNKWTEIQQGELSINDVGTFIVGHTGGTVGASTALMILPSSLDSGAVCPPCGVVVVILANLQGISLGKVAAKIANIFHRCLPSHELDD